MRGHLPNCVVAVLIALLACLDVFRIHDTTYRYSPVASGFSILVIPLQSRRLLRTTIIPKKSLIDPGDSFLITLRQSRQEFSQPEASPPNENSSLGINLGQDYSLALNETDREALRYQIKEMIDHRISTGILDLQHLHDRWERRVEGDLESLEQAMTLNGIMESKRFATKLDSIVGKFWNQTAASRKKTHDLFYLDEKERAEKAKEAEKRKAKRKKSADGSFQKQSWKKTNDAWDDWENDDW